MQGMGGQEESQGTPGIWLESPKGCRCPTGQP